MSQHLRRLLFALLCCLFTAAVFTLQAGDAAAQVPLTTQSSEDAPAQKAPALPGLSGAAETAEPAAPPGLLERLILQVRVRQQELQRDLVKLIRELKSEDNASALLLLIAASFIYGIFHAAGPGHGKMVISSYLLASEDRLRRGIKLTFLSSAAQAVTAILMVGLLVVVFDISRLEVTNQTRTLEIASYALVIAIGLWMLNGALRGKGCGHEHGHHEHHAHSCGHGSAVAALALQGPGEAVLTPTGIRQYVGIILAVGIRPCSGAVIVLLFTLAQNQLPAGIAATFAMALGTAITVSALAVLSVGSRKLALRIADSESPWQRRMRIGISVLGSLLVVGTGAILLLATLDQRSLL